MERFVRAMMGFLTAFCLSMMVTITFAQQPKAVITISGTGAVITKEGATYINSGKDTPNYWATSGTEFTYPSGPLAISSEFVLLSTREGKLSWVALDGESNEDLTAIESDVATTYVNSKGEIMIVVYKPSTEDVGAEATLTQYQLATWQPEPGHFTVDGVTYQYEWKVDRYVVTKASR